MFAGVWVESAVPIPVPQTVPQSVHTNLERLGRRIVVKGALAHRLGKMLWVRGCAACILWPGLDESSALVG